MVDSPYAIKFVFYIVFQALGVYFNLYYLVPKYLEKRRFAAYVVFTVLTIIAMAVLIAPGYYVSAAISGRSIQELYGADPDNFYYFFQVNTLPSSAAAMTLAMSVKFTKNWLQSKRREQLLEKDKLETELKFLRAQFHPHFLFNTINSIFVLIRKNPQQASDALEKFSSLLRYQLYECNEKQIPLRQELMYVRNYFELQKLRQDDNIHLFLDIAEQYPDELSIAPFILVPFIENAFKHVSRQRGMNNFIRVDVRLDGNVLQMEAKNSADNQPGYTNEANEAGGIGLENVRRRLELVYPGKHALEISHHRNEFTVKLQLQLEMQPLAEQSVSHPRVHPVHSAYV